MTSGITWGLVALAAAVPTVVWAVGSFGSLCGGGCCPF